MRRNSLPQKVYIKKLEIQNKYCERQEHAHTLIKGEKNETVLKYYDISKNGQPL